MIFLKHSSEPEFAAIMVIKPLDFSKIVSNSFDVQAPAFTADHFAKPCVENGSIQDYLRSLPTCGSGKELLGLIRQMADVRRAGRPLLLGIGGDVLEEGLSPIIIDLMERSIISGLALTGRAVCKDVEIACSAGLYTRKNGNENLPLSHDAAELINRAVDFGADRNLGLGEALGLYIDEMNCPHKEKSVLFVAGKTEVPVTAHLTIGTETSHFLPTAAGDRLGMTTHLDFRLFAAQVANLQGGVLVIGGSARILPSTFVNSLQAVRAMGYRVDDFAAGFLGGRGQQMENQCGWRTAIQGECITFFNIEGPYGILYPLVVSCLLDELSETC